MIRSIVTSALVVSIALTLGACASSPAGPAPAVATTSGAPSSLDGASYDVLLSFPGEAPVKDTLRFDGGRFESTACTSLGFPQWTGYRATSDRGAAGFEAVTHHPAGTTMEWKGHAENGGIEGSAVRTMNGQRVAGTFRSAR